MIGSAWKKSIKLNAKNLIGWRTKRKIVVFSVDDYGNVRLDSKEARDNLDANNIAVKSPFPGFDLYDALETGEDLEMLFEVLRSVQDKNGKKAVFSPFAVPCNPNFEKMSEGGYKEYIYELLPQTYSKLSAYYPTAYEGAWDLWKEGINQGLLIPQFHGREHFNLKVFEEKLEKKEGELLTILKNRSFSRVPAGTYETISISSAFGFWDFEEHTRLKRIIKDGLNVFEKVFGYRANHFMSPGGWEHPQLHKTLKECGIAYIDTPMIKREHQGMGKYKRTFNYTGKQNELGQTFMVRNVVFEPIHNSGVDWVSYTIQQIEAAFRWNRPAIISSHRVNFCGHIDEGNRDKGLEALQQLLNEIVSRWPEVEFMAANELGDLISSE
ncbi:hypothetical protein [Fodinibius salsisoli]|uniref:Polysaccharide (De)acetylase n=1 Tax=Fodinibius salsisoli TaxID=2820877 RepID=A0ABT3PLE5_9BACT|nr:hypothetical protein [Fodinibius salsisoli]MCW9706774.1 hypothetical protein [Fodinibius salsisoli]